MIPANDTDPLPLWSLAASELARDAGQARVLERAGTFHADAVEVICRRLAGAEVLAEEFRRVCSEEGVAPHHHNAWGALTAVLVKRGVIEDTGRLGKSQDPRSHARRQPVWRVVQDTAASR
jgi:hypothetical protein